MAYDEITPIKLSTSALPADPTVDILYTVLAKSRVFLTTIDVCNTTAASLDAYIYLVPSGGSPSTSNLLIPGVDITANSMMQWTGAQILNEGDTIRGKGSAVGITVNISGGEAI
jgi:hypothetical protein